VWPALQLIEGAFPDLDGEERIYLHVRQSGSDLNRTFEITFLGSGVQAYVFTFG
jgi:hypothetical protein